MIAAQGDSAARAQAAWLRALQHTAPIAQSPGRTFPHVVADLAQNFGDAAALISSSATLSYLALDARANRYARWAIAEGLAAGDVVCLMMPNAPEYLAAWIGITRVGGTVALLNTNVVDNGLVHAISIVSPRLVIAGGSDAAAAVRDVRGKLATDLRLWADHDAGSGFQRLDLALAAQAHASLESVPHHQPKLDERALYIYTSGTTGFPKAASISHNRLMQWSHWFAGMMDTQPSDRMYNVLPMYHAVGGIVATGAVLLGGGSVRIAERFSVSRFWDDVVDGECTLFQYIGELCRYLVNAAPHASEAQHKLRLACGNGLSLPVWQAFQQRFKVPHILEYYAATEGTFSLYNCEGKPGAIGRIPPFLRPRMPVAVIAHDVDSGEAKRGDDGFCIRCDVGEAGEAIGRIADGAKAGSAQFEGYTDAKASAAKILRDVFKAGDVWFRTGDLMRQDAEGYFYFVDRIGDTFRWKGENVSAAEVASVVGHCAGVREAIVYGVAVQGHEGRAGMAAVVIDEDFDMTALEEHVTRELPAYARPLFVRILPTLDATATFKPRKSDYVREGFDPALIRDPLFFYDAHTRAFIPLDTALHARLCDGAMRL